MFLFFSNDGPIAKVPAAKAAISRAFRVMFYGSFNTIELTESNASAFQGVLSFFHLHKNQINQRKYLVGDSFIRQLYGFCNMLTSIL